MTLPDLAKLLTEAADLLTDATDGSIPSASRIGRARGTLRYLAGRTDQLAVSVRIMACATCGSYMGHHVDTWPLATAEPAYVSHGICAGCLEAQYPAQAGEGVR